MAKVVTAIYKGTEYDITNFVERHPGGKEVLDKYLNNTNQITEVFRYCVWILRAIHSKDAEKELLDMPVVRRVEKNKNEKFYLKIEERIEKLYSSSFVY